MKFSKTLLYICLAVITLLLVKFIFLKKENPAPTQPAQSGPQKVSVDVQVVKPKALDNKIFATGSLLSNEEVVLMPEVSGRIEKIYFHEGSHVRKGDLLVKINDSELEAQLKKLNLQLELASETEGRQKKLLAIQGISQESYDIARNQEATLRADIEMTQALILKTSIRAPFDGTIGLKDISEGSTVAPGSRIASLQQTDPMKIDFSVPEKYAGTVKTGDAVHFTVSGIDTTFTGSIYAIEPRIDPVTRTLAMRATIPNRSGMLVPGSFARIELVLNRITNAVMIPTQALVPELKGQKVFVARQGKAVGIPVKTGIRTDTEVQITEGLAPGDSLIVSGFMQLKAGSPLVIKSKF